MTIGVDHHPFPEPPRVRRGSVYIGLALIAAAIPLTFPSPAGAVAAATVGGVAFFFGLLRSDYPWLGLAGASFLSSGALIIGALLAGE